MSLELEVDLNANVEIEAEVEVEAEIEVEIEVEVEVPEVELEVEIDAPSLEIEVEVEVPDIELNLQANVLIEAPVLEVQIEGDCSINLAKEVNIEIEVGGGGKWDISKPLRKWLAIMIIGTFFGILGIWWMGSIITMWATDHSSVSPVRLIIGISIPSLFIMGMILSIIYYQKVKTALDKGETEIVFDAGYLSNEVGGGFELNAAVVNLEEDIDVNTEIELPEVDIEFEAPQVELEVEIEVPDVEIEIEIEVPQVEIEVEVEIPEVEIEAEIEVEVEVEIEA